MRRKGPAGRAAANNEFVLSHHVEKSANARFKEVAGVYLGSNGAATQRLYGQLQELGPAGIVAMNLFRACKCSERAKVYRGGNGQGSYRAQAYERKQWSIDNLARVLTKYAEELSVPWGWGLDQAQAFHAWVIYVELSTGQVSFHTQARGLGPDYAKPWDKVHGHGPKRICEWAATLLQQTEKESA